MECKQNVYYNIIKILLYVFFHKIFVSVYSFILLNFYSSDPFQNSNNQ